MYNLTDKSSAKERILDATLNIISKEGFNKVTIRKIAAAANVNIAAVNYYFGSKDCAVNEALKKTAVKIEHSFIYLKDENSAPRQRLENFMNSYINASLAYHDIIRSFIGNTIINYPAKDEYTLFFKNEALILLKNNLKLLLPQKDKETLDFIAFQLMSSIIFPVIIKGLPCKVMDINFYDEEIRKSYVSTFLDSILG